MSPPTGPGIQRVSGSPQTWPLHDAKAARALEAAALQRSGGHALMARAGLAVAQLALAMAPHARRFTVWAGPGNNGGDGLVAARHLHAGGHAVQVLLFGDAARLPADAAWALDEARQAGVRLLPWSGHAPEADLHLDALLGLGTSRAPGGAIAQAIAALNRQSACVLAVDLPSGLHPDTGCLPGDEAVRATATLALLSLKPGLHTGQGRDHAGQVWLDTLGEQPDAPTAWLSGDAAAPPRLHASHKGSYGDVVVVGGAPGMAGAAWLAARAALAAGAGRVYCSLLDDSAATLDPGWPELMSRRRWWLSAPPVLAGATVVCGCGGDQAVQAALPPLLSRAGRLVLDADALNALAADAALRDLQRARAGRGLPTLLTPHPLEAARLLRCTAAQVQADRLAAALALAGELQATVLLKGSGSIIATPGCVPHINPTGNAALATAGTGDVLAGWAAGLWAQTPQAGAAEVAVRAAWQHGRAADDFSAALTQSPPGSEALAPLRRDAFAPPLRAAALVEWLAARAHRAPRD